MRDAWSLIDKEEESEKILVCQYGIPITVGSFSTIHGQPSKGSNAGWLNDEVWHPRSMDFVRFPIITIKKFFFQIHTGFGSTLCLILQIQSGLPYFKEAIYTIDTAVPQCMLPTSSPINGAARKKTDNCKAFTAIWLQNSRFNFLIKSEHGKCNMAQEKYYSAVNMSSSVWGVSPENDYWIRLLYDI